MPDYNRLSRDTLDDRLKGVAGEADHPWWNHRILFAHSQGVITDTERDRCLSRKKRVIKRYLWSIATNPVVRERLRAFAIVSSKLWHRLGAAVNLCAVEAGETPADIEALVTLLCGSDLPLKCLYLPPRTVRAGAPHSWCGS